MLNVPKVRAADPVPANNAAPVRAKYTISLTKPIQTHTGERRVLEFREPIGADYMELQRVPFSVVGATNQDRSIKIDFALAGKWIARLTDLDEIQVGLLSRNDFLAAVTMSNDILIEAGVTDMGNSGA